MPRLTVNVLLGFSLALVVAVQAWAGAGGSLGVGIQIAYHTPPTANSGQVDASRRRALGTLSATAASPGQTFTFEIVTQPIHGTVTLQDPTTGTFLYVAGPKTRQQVDDFTFRAVDTHGLESNIATETLLLHGRAQALSAKASTPPDTVLNGTLQATPAYPGEPLNFELIEPPSVGTFSLTDSHTGAFTYTPPTGFTGEVRLRFRVMDSVGRSSRAAEVRITVIAVPPIASDGSVATPRNQPVTGLLSATPAFAGQILTIKLVVHPRHGTVVITDSTSGTFRYMPDRGYLGPDRFEFRVMDQNGTSSGPAVESVTVHS